MADSEKLDNQRLKNFKNKGRDLEVRLGPGDLGAISGVPVLAMLGRAGPSLGAPSGKLS